MSDVLAPTFDLTSRTGWPENLRFLLERYPREVWQDHANLGDMARFWLQRHDMFRELGDALQSATQAFRAGHATAQDFRGWFAPRLQFFVSQLNAHHQVEDLHYFPVFSAAERRLAKGFAVLESDHETIHQAIVATVGPANDLLKAMEGNGDAMRLAGDRYADASERLIRQLTRHLGDEEDLIIPLILERSEQGLGVG
jgi:iron-sulfur cluster repair protein YtfE (RIC family)